MVYYYNLKYQDKNVSIWDKDIEDIVRDIAKKYKGVYNPKVKLLTIPLSDIGQLIEDFRQRGIEFTIMDRWLRMLCSECRAEVLGILIDKRRELEKFLDSEDITIYHRVSSQIDLIDEILAKLLR